MRSAAPARAGGRASESAARARSRWYAAPHASSGPHVALPLGRLRRARAAAARRCSARSRARARLCAAGRARTSPTCASSPSAARTPRPTGRSAASSSPCRRAERGGVRSHLPHARSTPTGAPRHARARVERQGRDDLLVLPARRPGGDLRVDRTWAATLPAAPRSQPGLRLGALPRLRHLRAQRRRHGRAPAHRHAGLRRRGDGVRQGRLDRLHVGARRRHRSLPHGRRRQEREAADRTTSATTAARSSTPTARRSSGARRGRSRARSWTTTRPARAEPGAARRSSSSTSPTPTASNARADHLPRRGVVRAVFIPAAQRIIFSSNYGDPKGREFDLWAIDVDGTRLERITTRAGLRRLPDVLARRQAPGVLVEPRHGAGRARHQRLRRRLAPTGATPSPRRGARRRSHPRRHPLARRSRRARAAASAPPASRRRARTSRSASQTLGLEPAGDDGGFRQAFPVRTGAEGQDADDAAALGGTPLAARRVRAARVLGARQGRRRRWCSPATASSTRSSASTTTPELDVQRQDRRRAPLRARARRRSSTPERAAPRRRSAPQGLDRARARRRGAARRRPARAARRTRPPTGSRPPSRALAAAAEGYGDAGIPVVVVKRAALAPMIEKLDEEQARGRARSRSRSATRPSRRSTSSARLPPAPAPASKLPGAVVIGAHYDHLGFGEHHSLAPDSHVPHVRRRRQRVRARRRCSRSRAQLAAQRGALGARRRVRRLLRRGGGRRSARRTSRARRRRAEDRRTCAR